MPEEYDSKEVVALAAANLIERTGLAYRQYHDRDTGCYCALGAFRMVMFGTTSTGIAMVVPEYIELITWFADKVRSETINYRLPESVIATWNDSSTKEVVVNKLREVGTA